MTTVILRSGTKSAVFMWHRDSDIMQVDIESNLLGHVERIASKMPKAAAREYWNMLKEQGYTVCRSQT